MGNKKLRNLSRNKMADKHMLPKVLLCHRLLPLLLPRVTFKNVKIVVISVKVLKTVDKGRWPVRTFGKNSI